MRTRWEQAPPLTPLPLINFFTDPEDQPQEWLLDWFIPEGEPTILFGGGGVGKSYIALTIGAHVVLGRNFYGIPTKSGPVLYLDVETQGSREPAFPSVCGGAGLGVAALGGGWRSRLST